MTRLALLLCLVVGGCANDQRLENKVRVVYCVGACLLTDYSNTVKKSKESPMPNCETESSGDRSVDDES